MRKRFLLSAGIVVILAYGLGLATRGGDRDEELSGLNNTEFELDALNLHLEGLIERVGPEHPDVLRFRQMPARRKLLQDDQVSQVLRMLDADEVTDQQLRESIVLLAKEILALRDRVEELERKTSFRVIPTK